MGSLGVDPFVIAYVANHASVTRGTVTGAVYNRHDYFPQKRSALTAWDGAFARIIAGGDPLAAPADNMVAIRGGAA